MNHQAHPTRHADVTTRLSVLALAAASALLPGAARAADPGAAAPGKNKAVTLEPIAGSTVKRVTLTAKAAERLDIQTGVVSEQTVLRRQMVSGLVIQPLTDRPGASAIAPAPAPATGAGGFTSFALPAGAAPAPVESGGVGAGVGAGVGVGMRKVTLQKSAASPTAAPPATAGAWVLVTLSPGEWQRLAKDKPARIVPLALRDQPAQEILAPLSDQPPQEDAKRSMLTLHYVLPDTGHGLSVGRRVRVQLQLAGDEDKQKVVPYRAVYYDATGAPWVYVKTRPLTYERQRIGVERVVGDLAVLSEGPASGTPVVTTGAALLYGTEIFGK